jgi:hypothetical protein
LDQRIVRALSSFITRGSDYALARLEFAMQHPHDPAPPLLDRLPDASEQTLRERWDRLERQLDAVRSYVRTFRGIGQAAERSDATFRRLARIARELDQYARALRWVLTVTERENP